MNNTKIKSIAECAVVIALSTVLSLIQFPMPFGGAITLFSMVPIIAISVKYGVKRGLVTSALYSIIQLFIGIQYLAYGKNIPEYIAIMMLDYIIAFTVLGLSGMLCESGKKITISRVCFGASIAIFLRFVCHVLSGVLIWHSIASAEAWSDLVKYGAWLYSIIYNGIYMSVELVGSLVALVAIIHLPILKINKKIK